MSAAVVAAVAACFPGDSSSSSSGDGYDYPRRKFKPDIEEQNWIKSEKLKTIDVEKIMNKMQGKEK